MFTLEKYRQAVAHKTEIRESDRGTYVVFDYVVTLKDTFDSLEARNARGIAFDKATGRVISLPYDKFHNYNECPGWMESDIDFSEPHVILRKEDGSMIRAIPDYSELGFHLGTRAGFTDVSKQASVFLFEKMDIRQRDRYIDFILDCLYHNQTPIFEYVAPTNQIVIWYDKPQLILTAVRENLSGEYLSYNAMVADATVFGIPVVQPIATEHSSIAELADHVKDMVGEEGVVVRFDSGKMVKMKGLDYVRKHKALDGLRWEKDVLKLIFDGALDDVLPLVDDDVRNRLVTFRDDVLRSVNTYRIVVECTYAEIPEIVRGDRKAFAEHVTREYQRPTFFFQMLDGKFDLLKFVEKNLNTQTQVNSIRDIIGQKSWYDYGRINVGDE